MNYFTSLILKVASNLDILQKNGITCIVNCCSMVVPDYFKGDSSFAYLDLNLLDGGFEDISWFCSDVVNFIETSRLINKKVLMHCERGISRSCALAIAYIICVSGKSMCIILMNQTKSCHHRSFRGIVERGL